MHEMWQTFNSWPNIRYKNVYCLQWTWWTENTYQLINLTPGSMGSNKDSGKKNDTMANVSIFCGNFFNRLEIEKYAFSFDIHTLLDQSTCGNNYRGNICTCNHYHGDFGLKMLECHNKKDIVSMYSYTILVAHSF